MLARPRIVLDTNIALALFLFDDLACAPLRESLTTHQPVANAATRGEWLRILAEGRFCFDQEQRKAAARAFDAATQLLDIGCDVLAALPRCRDPDDQKFLELAAAAGAVAVYTRDRELLKLSRRTARTAGFSVLAA